MLVYRLWYRRELPFTIHDAVAATIPDGCGVFRWSIRGLWLDGESFNNGPQMIGIIYWKMNDSRSSLVLVLVGAKMEGCG